MRECIPPSAKCSERSPLTCDVGIPVCGHRSPAAPCMFLTDSAQQQQPRIKRKRQIQGVCHVVYVGCAVRVRTCTGHRLSLLAHHLHTVSDEEPEDAFEPPQKKKKNTKANQKKQKTGVSELRVCLFKACVWFSLPCPTGHRSPPCTRIPTTLSTHTRYSPSVPYTHTFTHTGTLIQTTLTQPTARPTARMTAPSVLMLWCRDGHRSPLSPVTVLLPFLYGLLAHSLVCVHTQTTIGNGQQQEEEVCPSPPSYPLCILFLPFFVFTHTGTSSTRRAHGMLPPLHLHLKCGHFFPFTIFSPTQKRQGPGRSKRKGGGGRRRKRRR